MESIRELPYYKTLELNQYDTPQKRSMILNNNPPP